MTHQPGVYVPIGALFLVLLKLSPGNHTLILGDCIIIVV